MISRALSHWGGGIMTLTSQQEKTVLAAFLGWMLDAFDFFLLVFLLADIAKEFDVAISEVAYALFLTLAMRFIGALIFGRLGDHFGRKPILMLNIILYSAALPRVLTHPGGNITGFTFVEFAMGGKWVELLREIAPNTKHVALLFNPATAPPLKFYMSSIQAAASSFGIQVLVTPVQAKEEIEFVVAAQVHDTGGSLIVMPDAFNAANHELIISLAARYGVPALYGYDFARSGGLISYGSDFSETFHLAAGYIDRILKGAKAGELPIQLPTKFNLTLNLRTAKALSLTVPQSLRVAADEVIE